MKDDINIVGDVRFTEKASSMYSDENHAKDFMIKLQSLMKEFGIVKVDVCWDALKEVS